MLAWGQFNQTFTSVPIVSELQNSSWTYNFIELPLVVQDLSTRLTTRKYNKPYPVDSDLIIQWVALSIFWTTGGWYLK